MGIMGPVYPKGGAIAMRTVLVGASLLSGILFLASPVARACGDKLVSLGRGVRFQRAFKAEHPASILILGAGSSARALAKDSELQEALKQAGHKLQEVADSGSLQQALRSGKYDVVLADLSDAAGLAQAAQSAPSRPTLVPVMYKPDKSAWQAAAKQYSRVLKVPGKAGEYLVAIDEVMKQRSSPART